MKREYVFLTIAVLFVILILLSILVLFKKSPAPTVSPSPSPSGTGQAIPSPSQFNEKITPLEIEELPFIPQEQGGGIDVNSGIVKSSTSQIDKLREKLPYKTKFTAFSGEVIEILIPADEYQDTLWTLNVYITGLDYQSPDGTDEYVKAKADFLEGANRAFLWMKSNNVNPEELIISWGDRAFIQKRAEEWLSEQ